MDVSGGGRSQKPRWLDLQLRWLEAVELMAKAAGVGEPGAGVGQACGGGRSQRLAAAGLDGGGGA